MIRIVEFSRSENNADTGTGKPGNQLITAQNAKKLYTFAAELSIKYFNNSGQWSAVYRPIDYARAKKIAQAAEATARNVAVGYSWDTNPTTGRLTYKEALIAAGNDPSLIRTPCNGDCSSGVAAWVNLTGIAIPWDMTTRNEDLLLMATGEFIKIEPPLISWENLLAGDVLWRKGHTAVVLDDGTAGSAPFEVTSTATNLRTYPKIGEETKTGETAKRGQVLFIRPGIAREKWRVTGDDRRYWVASTYIRPIAWIIATGKVRIRSKPDRSAATETLEILDPGDRIISGLLTHTDERGVIWYSCFTSDQTQYGWISSMYSKEV